MQNAVRLGTLTVGPNHPDYLNLRVLVTLFGGYFGSRLMSNIREDKGYTYGISASLIPYPDSTIFMIASDTDPKYVDSLIQEVYHEMDRLKSEKVSEEELSKRRKEWVAPAPKVTKGFLARYARMVSSADTGAILT